MQVIFAILILAALVWITTSLIQKSRAEKATAMTSADLTAKNASSQTLSPDEKLVESLTALRQAIREKAAAENAALRDEIKSAELRLTAAKALGEKLGIAAAVAFLAEEMSHWHAWSTNPNYDFRKIL